MIALGVIGRPDERRCHDAAAYLIIDGEAERLRAGVPVDGTFGALLAGVGARSGPPAVIDTSLNLRGEPMVLTPDDALDLMRHATEIDMLALGPYLVRRC